MRAAAALALFLAAAGAGAARAQSAAGRALAAPLTAVAPLPPAFTSGATPLRFKVSAWPDAAVLGAGLAVAAIPTIWSDAFPHATCAPCDPAALWGVDRGAVGPVRAAADAFSAASLGAEAVLGTLFLAASRRGEGTAPFVEDAVVIAQAVTFAAAAEEWTKVAFHRPRPFLYLSSATAAPSADDGRSFPSGHASIAFAAAAAYASLLHRRGIAGQHKAEIAALLAAAAATGVLRVVAHRHFPTDVAAGAGLGLAIGWAVPALHPTRP